MSKKLTSVIALGKLIRRAAMLRGGGGSALSGLVIERLMPEFLEHMLAELPDGVIIITGTNGKTTTTKMIADLLESFGKRVLTNRTGSNFTRGIVATIVQQADLGGVLDYDVAVLELDEAYAKRFVQRVRPDYVVALNVMRDQLDRFGELDSTAKLIAGVLQRAHKGCVINRDDPLLATAGKQLKTPVSYFAVDKKLREYFPTDDELHAGVAKNPTPQLPRADVELVAFKNQAVTYAIGKHVYTQELQITGQYNFQNAAAALALANQLMPEVDPKTIVEHLAQVRPAFGRGETIDVDGQPLEMILVKNPAGFRQALLSFTSPAATMIAINDNYADGRDMSWLWDVDFGSLQKGGVGVVSGIRAFDMALRLQYDEVPIKQPVEPDLPTALKAFLAEHPHEPKRIFCTYTAMLALRAQLAKLTEVERVL